MKKLTSLFLLTIYALSTIFAASPAWAEAKFISGYTDGLISTYAIIEYNGIKYRTDENGQRTNTMLWNQLNEDDRRKLMKYYWSPNARKTDFGSTADSMATWANDAQGWSNLVDALKQKRANKNYPDLKAYYDKPLEMPHMSNVKCTDQIRNCDIAKEAARLNEEIQANHRAGQEIYKKLVDIKWDQVGTAVKSISANLIPIIVDNFMTGFITGIPNGANQMSQFFATTFQFATGLKDFVKNNPNDGAEIIKKLDTLCDMMEADARTAIDLVEKDKARLQSIYVQLARLCEEDVKSKEKHEEEKKKILKEITIAEIAETGLIITSPAKTEEEREREIAEKVRQLNIKLNAKLNRALTEAKIEYDEIIKGTPKVKQPEPIKICDGNYPKDVNSHCFKMYYSVREIKEWEPKFPKFISESAEKIDVSEGLLQSLTAARAKHAKKIKTIQAEINELVAKYKKYLPYKSIENSIEGRISYYTSTIDSLEKDIERLKLEKIKAEDTEKIVKDGLSKRIEREINDVRPYHSLEANFINSLWQISESVYNLDNLYDAEELTSVYKKAHKPSINQAKIKEVRAKIAALKTQEERDKEIELIVKRLKTLQKEVNHQIKRLIAAQNNAFYDNQKLNEFLKVYTDGLYYTITGYNKVKQDVLEVTGVRLKDTYSDIVKDWENGDYYLWMMGSGNNLRWGLTPENFIIDLDTIIEQLDGKNQFYNSLEVIHNEVKNNKTSLLSMDGASFSKKYNEYSTKSYAIIQDATNRGEDTDKVKSSYINILNILSEIHTDILTRERVKNAVPVLKKDIDDAKALLNSAADTPGGKYEEMISRLLQDTKEGSEAYYARTAPELAPLFTDINNLIDKLKNALEKNQKVQGNENLDKIKTFYNEFKQAYESKSEYELVNFLSNNWDSADGTSISDLEDNFRNMFSVYDSIQYNISNIQVAKRGDNLYFVNYDVTIVGQIYDMGITRNEKSSVAEEVVFEKGKPRIHKTLNGRFWYRE